MSNAVRSAAAAAIIAHQGDEIDQTTPVKLPW
jgi:hypothetical protein